MRKISIRKWLLVLAAVLVALVFYDLYKQRSNDARATVSAVERALTKCPDMDTNCEFGSSHVVYRIQELEPKRKPQARKTLAGEVLIRVQEQKERITVIKKITISPEGEVLSALRAGPGINSEALQTDDPEVVLALAHFRKEAMKIN